MADVQDLYVDPALTQVAAERESQDYVMDQLYPRVYVKKQTGKIYKNDPNRDRLREKDTTRAPGTAAKSATDGSPTKISYDAEDHSLEGKVTDEERENVDPGAQASILEVEDVVDQLKLQQEIEGVAEIIASVTAQTTAYDWSNLTTANPISDLKDQFSDIEKETGMSPNCITIPRDVLRVVMECDKVKERVTSVLAPGQLEVIGEAEVLRQLLGGKKVLSPLSFKNTAKYGDTPNLEKIWGNRLLLSYWAAPRLRYAALGITVTWTGKQGSNRGMRVETDRSAKTASDLFYVHDYRDTVTVNANAADLGTVTLPS